MRVGEHIMETARRPRIAIYTRVSSEEQAAEGFSLEDQRAHCLAKLDALYGENLYACELFSDEGISGKLGLYDPAKPKKRFRPDLTRLKDALDRGQFDAVCIYGLDRLSRNYSLLPKLIEDVFGDGSVKLISVREVGIDLETPTGRAMAQLLNTSNALICDIGGQICKDASLRRRSAGYPIRAPLGWRWKADKDPNGRRGIEPDPERAADVKFIISEALSGKGARTIEKELLRRGIKTAQGTDRWYKKLVVDILLQPQHYGLVHIGNGEHVRGAHYEDRFFDPEDFETTRRLLAERTGEPVQFESRPEHLLAGMIDCDACHTKMRARQAQGRHSYYICHCDPAQEQLGCRGNSLRTDWADREVLEHIHTFLAQPSVLAEARKQAAGMAGQDRKRLDGDRRRLQSQIEKTHEAALRWSRRYNEEEDISRETFRQLDQQYQSELAEAQEALAHVERQLSDAATDTDDWSAIEQALSDMRTLWEQLTPPERKQVLREIIDRVSLRKLEDGSSEIRIKPRFAPEHLVLVPSLRGQVLTKRQMEALWLLGQNPGRKWVAKQLGQTVQGLNCTIRAARRRLEAATVEEAIERGREIITPYAKWLDLQGRAQRLEGRAGQPKFTAQETRVLQALGEGLNGPQIAQQLRMQPNTLYVHFHNMREKVGAGTNKQLLDFAKRAGLMPQA
jgi:site-specific DNA recombinase